MSYVNAPAVEILATCCAVCARPLLDAVSVETGVGPICREKMGFGLAGELPANLDAARALIGADLDALDSDDARAMANKLVHRIALEQVGPRVLRFIEAVSELGFVRMASILASRLGSIKVEVEGTDLIVHAPFSIAFNNAVRKVPGQRFEKVGRRGFRRCPMTARKAMWAALQVAFPKGTLVAGPKGCKAL